MFSAFADAGLQPQFIMKQINVPKKSQKRKAEDDAPSATHGKVDAKEENARFKQAVAHLKQHAPHLAGNDKPAEPL
ncbi:hypothetical protein G7Y79_00011g030750 [Physcia stellaris]|nr:hypothetical protein G7Y79_00011g030750 [Physcia stellaris]